MSDYSLAESVQKLAEKLIAEQHPHLASAAFDFLYVDKEMKSKGRPLYGKVSCPGSLLKFYIEKDFVLEIGLPSWNELAYPQRVALIDHLLERCHGEEDDKTGDMKYSLRDPDVQEFGTILHRHGAWNDTLRDFCSVAQRVDFDAIADQEAVDAEQDVTEFLTQKD